MGTYVAQTGTEPGRPCPGNMYVHVMLDLFLYVYMSTNIPQDHQQKGKKRLPVNAITFLIRAHNAFPVCIWTKACHLALSNVIGPLVVDGALQTPVPFDTLLHLVTRTCCSLVLIVASVSDLRILTALESL